ncbi:MAG: redox-regulated ATPase YchF [Omnitrophica bacterium RIFCSPHIGHO2_02_FULL_51_18]|nr:MAG: redox-regulated ATPase YchF [Omnitrophica bacterium RIFCSPHIGHO2_02_FULL_51_18]
MGFKCGIVGLPNVGKSTIFNALTRGSALVANYPFATIDPNVGIVPVPDARLKVLTEIVPTQKVVPTTVEIVDIAGIVEGASKGEGLGNQFLSHIAEVDAIIEVVRCFEGGGIVHVSGSVDALRDIEVIHTELILKDLETLSKHKTRCERAAKSGDKKAAQIMTCLDRYEKGFNEGKTGRETAFAPEERALLREVRFLTDKPVLYAANIAEEELGKPDSPRVADVRKKATEEGSAMMTISGKVEEEISKLDPGEREDFLKAMNMKESGLDKLAREGHKLLNLITFFTVGETENRAWNVEKGSTAPAAAGKIHSDFERGFIRAEVVGYNDFVQYRGEQGAREKGKFRLEGKEYVVQDGDVMHFRFSV